MKMQHIQLHSVSYFRVFDVCSLLAFQGLTFIAIYVVILHKSSVLYLIFCLYVGILSLKEEPEIV